MTESPARPPMAVDPYSWKIPITSEAANVEGPLKPFSIQPPAEIESGKFVQRLVSSDIMSCYLRVSNYGEKSLHSHPDDAIWLVLEGEATYFNEQGEIVSRVGKMNGLLVPRGEVYRYDSTGQENLVILRVSALPGDNSAA
jgi:mannose-6-phosphate isomerase-like protein (cupin superfamily)